MTNPVRFAAVHLAAFLAWSLIGWRIAIQFDRPRGAPGFGWFVWCWPIAAPLAIVCAFYAGIREAIAVAFSPSEIPQEEQE